MGLFSRRKDVTDMGLPAAGAAPGAPSASPAVAGPAVDVRLVDCGRNMIHVIKAIRQATEVDLRTAKDLAEAAPTTIAVPAHAADRFLADLADAGAVAELASARPSPSATEDGDSGDEDDLVAQLERLTQLHAAGALSADEFAAAKAKLLADG